MANKNLADALTKAVGTEELKVHMDGLNLEIRKGRPRLAPGTDGVTEEGLDLELDSVKDQQH